MILCRISIVQLVPPWASKFFQKFFILDCHLFHDDPPTIIFAPRLPPHFLRARIATGYDTSMPCNLGKDATSSRHTYSYNDYDTYTTKKAYQTIKKTKEMLRKSY